MPKNSGIPDPKQAEHLKSEVDTQCALAAEAISEADVLLVITGAGFSADSGLAVYGDVAQVEAYRKRNLEYHDVSTPHWLTHEPGLFWGFWGQCFNDYRSTQPHKGYETIAKWRDDKNCKPIADELRKYTQEQEKTSTYPVNADEVDPFLVQGRAGAFYFYTSNVDAHSYDFFLANEIQECHGNIELWQCHEHSFGEPGKLWRAPLNHRFIVDKETMLAPPGPATSALPGDGSFQNDENVVLDRDPTTRAHVGHTLGARRRNPLKHMIERNDGDEFTSTSIVEENWPKCRVCDGYARPTIFMFGDMHWKDNDAQELRWLHWKDGLYKLAADRRGEIKVTIVEIGCGLNVATNRYQSESMVHELKREGAKVKLIRVNPDFPLIDNDEYVSCDDIISVMASGLAALEKMDAVMIS